MQPDIDVIKNLPLYFASPLFSCSFWKQNLMHKTEIVFYFVLSMETAMWCHNLTASHLMWITKAAHHFLLHAWCGRPFSTHSHPPLEVDECLNLVACFSFSLTFHSSSLIPLFLVRKFIRNTLVASALLSCRQRNLSGGERRSRYAELSVDISGMWEPTLNFIFFFF